MGDRVSVQFENDGERSVTLFSHWGGEAFGKEAAQYARALPVGREKPLDRREPATVMVDFIRHLLSQDSGAAGDLYLGADPADGDNGDNGNFVIVFEANGKTSVRRET